MYTCYIQTFKILWAFSWAGWFESYLFENPQRHVFAQCGSNSVEETLNKKSHLWPHWYHVMRKPVYAICNQQKRCSAIETSYSLESLHLASVGTILSGQRTTKMLIRLMLDSASLLFPYGINKFCHDTTHIFSFCKISRFSMKIKSSNYHF